MNGRFIILAVLGLSLIGLASSAEQICDPTAAQVACFLYNPQPGCLCTAPNKCKYTSFDSCSICNDKTVYSYFAGEECPVVSPIPTTPAPNKPQVCDPSAPKVACLLYNPQPGCLCTAPNSCKNTTFDVCSICNDKSVYSYISGQSCPAQSPVSTTPAPSKPQICDPNAPKVACLVYNPKPGCLCTAPNKCKDTTFDPCGVCNDKSVYSYLAGQKCPVTTPAPEVNYWEPSRCPDLKTVRCTPTLKLSCACYKDGTCKRILSNVCRACSKSNVVSFNYGEKCPKLDKKVTICPAEPVKNKICTKYITEGCKCYTDGTCEQGYVNKCSDCGREDVTLVIEGGKCPIKRN